MRIEEPAVDTADAADVAEQRAELGGLDAPALDDGGYAGASDAVRPDLPLEADPADVAEQDAAVPYDDEER
jgi:hypothetical protein